MENLILFLFIGLLCTFATLTFGIWKHLLRKKTASRKATLLFSLMTFSFFSSLLLTGGEIYFRWFHDSTDSFGLSKTTENWFIRHYKPNSLGMRDDREYELTSKQGKRRLILLGDSFTAGHGIKDIEERFANHLRDSMKEWDIHIFARNGWDTTQQIKLLNLILSKGYELDTVLLVYVLNDISEIVPKWQEILKRIYKNHGEEFFLVRHSFLINYFYYRLKAVFSPNIANYYGFVSDAYQDEKLWSIQKSHLNIIKSTIEKNGGTLKVVTFPFIHLLGKNYDEYLEIHKKIDEFWKKKNISHLDLYKTYQNYSTHELTVNKWDAHPNKFAHKLAAEEILKFLKSD